MPRHPTGEACSKAKLPFSLPGTRLVDPGILIEHARGLDAPAADSSRSAISRRRSWKPSGRAQLVRPSVCQGHLVRQLTSPPGQCAAHCPMNWPIEATSCVLHVKLYTNLIAQWYHASIVTSTSVSRLFELSLSTHTKKTRVVSPNRSTTYISINVP